MRASWATWRHFGQGLVASAFRGGVPRSLWPQAKVTAWASGLAGAGAAAPWARRCFSSRSRPVMRSISYRVGLRTKHLLPLAPGRSNRILSILHRLAAVPSLTVLVKGVVVGVG